MQRRWRGATPDIAHPQISGGGLANFLVGSTASGSPGAPAAAPTAADTAAAAAAPASASGP
jgi:hypothetical protein